MTRIEEMLRATLAETPTATSTTDPIGALDGRIRRARRRVGLGAGLGVVALAVAVAVPPAATGGSGPDSKAIIGDSPTPSPSAGVQAGHEDVWMTGGAHGVATNDARGHVFAVT